MNALISIGICLLALVILEAFAYYGVKKDQEKFEKLSPDEKWKLQQEARKDHLLGEWLRGLLAEGAVRLSRRISNCGQCLAEVQ